MLWSVLLQPAMAAAMAPAGAPGPGPGLASAGLRRGAEGHTAGPRTPRHLLSAGATDDSERAKRTRRVVERARARIKPKPPRVAHARVGVGAEHRSRGLGTSRERRNTPRGPVAAALRLHSRNRQHAGGTRRAESSEAADVMSHAHHRAAAGAPHVRRRRAGTEPRQPYADAAHPQESFLSVWRDVKQPIDGLAAATAVGRRWSSCAVVRRPPIGVVCDLSVNRPHHGCLNTGLLNNISLRLATAVDS